MSRSAGPWRRTPFVGREQELTELSGQLEQAEKGGAGRLVLVAGEPGVGKTRLVVEFAHLAHDRGWQVLSGRAYESEGMPAYLPFVEALRGYVRDCPLELLRSHVDKSGPEIGLLLPGVTERIVDLPAVKSSSPEGERYQLFESVSTFLFSLAESRSVLLCLDDLHWADRPSLLLLQYLARRLGDGRVVVLGTYRTVGVPQPSHLGETLASLSRERLQDRLLLDALSLAETGRLIEAFGNVTPAKAVMEAIYQETNGNSFFVEEVVRHLQADGRDLTLPSTAEEELGIPEGVREVLSLRLSRLSPNAVELLQAAAVSGRDFEIPVLQAATGLDATDVTHGLEEGLAAGMVRDEGILRFSHPIVREVVYGQLSMPRRQRLHLEVARAMEGVYSQNPEPYLAFLASQYCLAGPAADAEKVVEYCRRAGDRALAMRAYEESIRLHAEAVAALVERTESKGREALLADLHHKLGQAHAGLASWVDAGRELSAALELGSAEPSEQRTELLLELAVACRWNGDLNRGRKYAEEAREIAEGLQKQDLLAGATASLAFLEFSRGEIRKAAASYRSAIELAQREDSAAAKQALAGFAHLLYLSGRHRESIDNGLESVRLARRSNDVASLTYALGPLGLALASTGRYQEAEEAFAEARQVGQRYGISAYLARATAMSASPHFDLFDFKGALQKSEEAGEIAREVNFRPAVISTMIDQLFARLRSGDIGYAIDRFAAARQVVMDNEKPDGTWLHSWLWNIRLGQLEAEIALARRDWREAATRASASIETSRARQRLKYEGAGLETRGKALVALGRKAEALRDMTAALDAARRSGDPAMLVRVAATMLNIEPSGSILAEALRDRERVMSSLPDGPLRASFQESEAFQTLTRLAGRGDRKRDTQSGTSYPDGLSEREVEVLRLVASGCSNSAIAEQMLLSQRTVERHLTNIYSKSGAHNKAAATAYALRNRLA